MRKNLDAILRMDFMSHFVFRLFENLNVDEDDPKRFNLEIMVNRGAVTGPADIQFVKDHTIPIRLDKYIEINKKLDLETIDTFLQNLANLSQSYANKKEKTKKKKDSEENYKS